MTAQEVADKIAECAQNLDWVSQENIIEHCGGDILRGDRECYSEETNVVFHVCVSSLFIEAINILRHERPRRVVAVPMNPLVARIDGVPLPKLPFAKRPPRGGRYKETHYLLTGYRPWSALTEKEKSLLGVQ